jgi:hypothetical protein
MSERQLSCWNGMVVAVLRWMDADTDRLPESCRVPGSLAEEDEQAVARTLAVLRGAQDELQAGAPHLYSLLEEVSCTHVCGRADDKLVKCVVGTT